MPDLLDPPLRPAARHDHDAGRQVDHPPRADARGAGRGRHDRRRLGARRSVPGDAALHAGAGRRGRRGRAAALRIHGKASARADASRRCAPLRRLGHDDPAVRRACRRASRSPACSTGTEPLRRRPMGRVAEPLRLMGATVLGREGGKLPPLTIRGGSLRASTTRCRSRARRSSRRSCWPGSSPRARRSSTSRDRRAITPSGCCAGSASRLVTDGPARAAARRATARRPRRTPLVIPGDFSSAAFPLVAASIVRRSDVRLGNVGVNPTRTGLHDLLLQMGGVTAQAFDLGAGDAGDEDDEAGEPVGELAVLSAELHAAEVGGDMIVRAIDEFPDLRGRRHPGGGDDRRPRRGRVAREGVGPHRVGRGRAAARWARGSRNGRTAWLCPDRRSSRAQSSSAIATTGWQWRWPSQGSWPMARRWCAGQRPSTTRSPDSSRRCVARRGHQVAARERTCPRSRRAAHGLTGRTQLVGVMGWPVSHSRSPRMHNAAFAALGLDWAYVPLPVAPDRVEAAVAGLRGARVRRRKRDRAAQAGGHARTWTS